jgi:hypothetical protein
VDKASGFDAIVNSLVWDNGYTQAVPGLSIADSPFDIHVYLHRPESSLVL